MDVLTDYGVQEKQEEIVKWLNLPNHIGELEKELELFSKNYYQEHSFYSHIVYDDVRGIISESPKVEKVAIGLADASMVKSRRIKRLKWQYEQFKDYLSRLPIAELDKLETKYLKVNNSTEYGLLDQKVYEFIQQINDTPKYVRSLREERQNKRRL